MCLGLTLIALLSAVAPAIASEPPPSIESESVSNVTFTDATLEAQILPGEAGAYYQFQLVKDPAEFLPEIVCPNPFREPFTECGGPSVAGALPIGFVGKDKPRASLQLSKQEVVLKPGTTYHYRVLVARAVESEDVLIWEEPTDFGADQTFTTAKSPQTESPPPPLPSNLFGIRRASKNPRKGTASLPIVLPGAGQLTLSGRGAAARSVTEAGPGMVRLAIVPKGRVKRALVKRGEARIMLTVVFTPTGGLAASKKFSVVLRLNR